MRGAVIKARVGKAQAPQLISYLDTIPLDEDKESHSHGRRITSNPLMLSMVISLYERRVQGGVAMPTRIVELYAEATSAMLSRALGDYSSSTSAATITALLQAIFFCAHAAQHRVISEPDLESAAESLGSEQAEFGADDVLASFHQLRRLAKQDRMPLLSLLQSEPLELQSSHLSFQEYFAARASEDALLKRNHVCPCCAVTLCAVLCAVCSGAQLPAEAAQPWKWSAWWANTVRLGREMEGFGRGLCRAAAIEEGGVLDLEGKLDKRGSQTALAAVIQIALGGSLTAANVLRNSFDDKSSGLPARFRLVNEPPTTI